VVVHEFQTELTEAGKHAQNHRDLEDFLSVLSGGKVDMEAGKMYDGFSVNGMDLMIGKVVTALKTEKCEMPYSQIEKEVVFLKAIQVIIDEMVNHEVMKITGTDPDSQVLFKTMTHQRFFNIILVDFLSSTAQEVMGESTPYLQAISKICDNPCFRDNGSIETLKVAVNEFRTWLREEVEVEVCLPAIEMDTTLKIIRFDFLKMCGNISKHNFSRLSGVASQLIKIFDRNSLVISLDEALLALDDFYDRFHYDILNYHASTISEFLNNIRWGIHEYLLPEYRDSYENLGGNQQRYQFRYPPNLNSEFTKQVYWDLMNIIRSGPLMERFTVSRYVKLRY
jgi:hypothetical protein